MVKKLLRIGENYQWDISLNETQQILFERLRKWRRERSKKEGLPKSPFDIPGITTKAGTEDHSAGFSRFQRSEFFLT